ncbi:MAG TPA: hypothetical protein VFN68_06530 [Acidimicrobiales bacterium]|nr:hypothetical protein [Acidimicrobiales bacterium]
MTTWTGRSCRALAAASVLAATGVVAGGCGSPTPVVSNGSVSACYRALPVGRQALHAPEAKLIGVHRIPVDAVRARLPASARAELAAENDTAVCAMAFHGTFAPGQIQAADPAQSGDYALVLVSSRRLHLVAAIVLKHLPRAFGGRTF